MIYFIIYLVLINLFSAAVTVYDKSAAIKRRTRIAERHLFAFAAIGGAPAMYITMLIIRHKTAKMKFMLGIPVIFVTELVLVIVLFHYVYKVF